MTQVAEADRSVPERSSDPRLAVGVAVAAIGALAVAAVAAASGTGQPPLGPLESAFGLWVGLGGHLHEIGTHAAGALRAGIAATGVLVLAASFRSEHNAPALRAAGAVCIGWLAQFELADSRVGSALLLYALSIGVYLWAAPWAPQRQELTRRTETLLVIAAIALFAGHCLHEIHLRPELYVDEFAYASAAKMAIGLIPEGPIEGGAYRLERFIAQPIGLAIHSAALAWLPGDVLPLRAVSIGLGAASLFVSWIALRGAFGSAAAVLTLVLASASPLLLAYSRTGFYIALSVFHASLCFLVLLRLRTHWNAVSVAALGGLLGVSIYLYQLSWFVPVFVGLGVLASPDLFRRARWAWFGAIGVALACAVALPWFALPEAGIEQLSQQTFNKSLLRSNEADLQIISLLSPADLPAESARLRLREFAPNARLAPLFTQAQSQLGESLSALLNRTQDGRIAVSLTGMTAEVSPLAEALLRENWLPLYRSAGRTEYFHRIRMMLSMLFARASWESHLILIDRAILNPLLAPFLVLGCVCAIRFWRDRNLRVLGIWLVAAAFLPAHIGGEFPRRAALIEPLQYGLAAVALLAAAPQPGTRARKVALLVLVVLAIASAAVGAHLSARHWAIRVSDTPKPSMIETAQVILRESRRNRIVLAARILPNLRAHLIANAKADVKLVTFHPIQPLGPAFVLRETCARDLPLSWVVPEAEDGATLREILRANFSIETVIDGELAIVRVGERRPDGCRRI